MKLKQNSDLQSEISLPMPETQPFSQASIHLTLKADLGTQKDSTLFEHKVRDDIIMKISSFSSKVKLLNH